MLRPAWRIARPTSISPRRHLSDDIRPFAEKDHVILHRQPPDRYASPILLRLEPGAKKDTHKGRIHHDNIIGKLARQVVESTLSQHAEKKGLPYRIHQVTLEEYVRLTRRLVTPLYPQDAQLIVSMLDLHPELPAADADSSSGPLLEILEAGTGHGALTLYLSRAIHAANPAIPALHSSLGEDEADEIISRWKPSRRAVIHTIELSPKYSNHARNVVRGFRRGLYYPNVDFHVGSVGPWITAALASRQEPFLSHAFLDLAGSDDHLPAVAAALKPTGKLIVFNPSITQIMDCLAKVKEENLPLELEHVIELGVNGGTGGREWDLRAVLPRAAARTAVEQPCAVDADEGTGGGTRLVEGSDAEDEDEGALSSFDESPFRQPAAPLAMKAREDWKMVCRPKVGDLTVGGGFLGVFAKIRR